MSRFKLVTRTIQDSETDHVLDLAHAGIQRKTIAKEAYGSDSRGNPTPESIRRVDTILMREGIGVTAYRRGENSLGRSTIVAIRKGTDILTAIRAASKERLKILKSA